MLAKHQIYADLCSELFRRHTWKPLRTYIFIMLMRPVSLCLLILLDIAGSIPFRYMRDLYISKTQEFAPVYSITDENSFLEFKYIWEQIQNVRQQIFDIPCVIVGNNLDEENVRKVETFVALNWACSENLGALFV